MPLHEGESISTARSRVLAYLSDIHTRNPRAEVSGQELQHELGLDEGEVRECVEYLVREGLASADLFPRNIWVRLAEGETSLPFGP